MASIQAVRSSFPDAGEVKVMPAVAVEHTKHTLANKPFFCPLLLSGGSAMFIGIDWESKSVVWYVQEERERFWKGLFFGMEMERQTSTLTTNVMWPDRETLTQGPGGAGGAGDVAGNCLLSCLSNFHLISTSQLVGVNAEEGREDLK